MVDKIKKVIVVGLIITTLSGCGSVGGSNVTMDSYNSTGITANNLFSAQTDSIGSYEASVDEVMDSVNNAESGTEHSTDKEERGDEMHKLITTMDMRVQTKEFDTFNDTLVDTVNSLGGYIEDSSVQYNSYDFYTVQSSGEEYIPTDRSAHYVLRIPEDKLDGFVEKLYGGTNVLSENRSVEDVTLDYVDLDSHKGALETEAKSLEKMLEQAVELEDIMQIQTQLTNVRYQIDSIESQLRVYDNKVAYSTLNLSVEEVVVYSVRDDAGYFEKIGAGFKKSLSDLWECFKDIVATLLINIPQVVLLGGLALVGWLVFKRKVKRTDEVKVEDTSEKDKVVDAIVVETKEENKQ